MSVIEYTIETGVPLPPGIRMKPSLSLPGTLRQLQPGESVFVPFNGREPKKLQNTIGTTLVVVRRQIGGGRFARRIRNIAQHGEEGIRVWRLTDAPAETQKHPSRPEDLQGGAADQRPTPEPLG